jgi:hypothetical protein
MGGQKKTKKMFAILKNVIAKSVNNWRVLQVVKINTRILDTLCMYIQKSLCFFTNLVFYPFSSFLMLL